MGRLLALPARNLKDTNALAYFVLRSVTEREQFYNLETGLIFDDKTL
jgi:hypothetical protein